MAEQRMVYINNSFFRQLKEFQEDFQHDARKVKWAIDKVVFGYAMVALGEAQQMSRGPLDPSRHRHGGLGIVKKPPTLARSNIVRTSVGLVAPTNVNLGSAAWKIPVRRITGKYYRGWKYSKLGNARYLVYNDSREAYFIEFGINHVGTGLTASNGKRVRVRRPIMKLAVIKALNFARASKFDMNIISATFSKTAGSYHSPELLGYRSVLGSGVHNA